MKRFLLVFCAAGSLVLGSLQGAIPVHGSAVKRPAIQPWDDEPWDDELKGEVKSIDFDSKHLGETREVKVYLPPGHDRKKSYPVLYAADGFDAVNCALLESLITAGKVPPFIVVGMAHAPGERRQLEYCPGWDPDQPEPFEAHEKFFIKEVLPWAEREFGASRERKNRVVYGSSNGAPFALTMANRHPKLFGHVFAFMVYGLKFDIFKKELKEQPKDPARYLLVVGSEDGHGIKENQAVEKLLKEKKFPVVSVIIEGMGHSSQLEHQELPGCVEAAFRNKKYQPKGKSIKELKELKGLRHLLSWAALGTSAALAEDRIWEKLRLPEGIQGRTLRGVSFVDAKHGWIVGDKGLCLATRDGGANWEVQKTGSEATLRCVQFQDVRNGWICGDGDPKAPAAGGHTIDDRPLKAGTVLHTTDGGKTWETSWVRPTNFELTSIEASAAPWIQIGTSGGEDHLDGNILHSLAGGKQGSWKLDFSLPAFRTLFALRAVTDKRWVAVGSPLVFIPSDGVELYDNKACRALYSEDGGKTWKTSKGSEGPQRPYLDVDFEEGTLKVSQVVWGGLAEKAGIRTGDAVVKLGGDKVASREELAKSLKQHKPGEKVPVVVQRDAKPVTLTARLGGRSERASLRSVAVGKKQAILAVGDRGAILRSTDAGVRWESVTSPTTASLRGVTWCGLWAVAVGTKGKVLFGKDNGKSWEQVPTDQTQTLNSVAAAGDCIIAVGQKGIALRAKAYELARLKKRVPR